MIDVSDGLIQDLGHICQASGVGARIQQNKLPLSSAYRALAGTIGMMLCLERRRRLRAAFLRHAAAKKAD